MCWGGATWSPSVVIGYLVRNSVNTAAPLADVNLQPARASSSAGSCGAPWSIPQLM